MIEVLKASAGAGKTHRLTGEYMELLFSKPFAFKHILAVTFTNKATDEMKQRILEQLHLLSQPGEKSDYLERIMNFTGKDEVWVREKAKEILVSILHDYTSFRVSTIDKFFQLVMRSFARELGRMATYNVELDKDSVLMRAVDKMFSQLDEPQNQKLLEWLIDYSLEAVDKGSSWNVKGEILKLGNQIFSEEFKLAKEKGEKNFEDITIDEVARLKNSLKAIADGFEKELVELAQMGNRCIDEGGLSASDFKGGSRSPFNYFQKVEEMKRGKGAVVPPAATFMALYDNKGNWYKGKSCPGEIEAVYPALNEIVGKIISLFENGYRGYATAMVLLSNVNVLGILNDIYARVLEYCREKNIILLSESTELLGKIIDGSDTPFVYEKLGVRYENFLLDEFQDTSGIQWENFLPLVSNSNAQGG
ncbi:MAG: UvrD-helicase domain-containing protein, partial [Bacteroidales bacterium]|nr:UvrD-helicase domain-containing protein [Bacteroidales bacterium]